jgi:uncharacterized protein (DUF927 family)
MLANGQGKSRATRNGSARGIASWRLLFLSSGEVSLSAMMQRANQKAQAGQEVRMLDIEADAGAGMGVFEDIHGAATPADFAGALKDASKKQYGMVGMKYLQKLAEEHASLGVPLKKLIEEFVERVLPNGASGQVTRAANRFALCAVAGELATRYGLTGWPIGSATNAAEACFKSWYVGFGGAGNKEDRGILAQVRGFFELHGNGRFENLDSYSSSISERVHNRAGFFRNRAFPPLDKPVREYLVLTEVFKAEICEGYDARKVGRVLREAGWLNVGEGTHLARHETLPGLGRTRCYVFNHEMWDSDALSDIH